jgi:tRNA threonylcarbamoyladenosine biosynthesis protein TsaE
LFTEALTEEAEMSKKVIINGLSHIEEAAREFLSKKGDAPVIALYGEMGAGKTTFTKSLCKVLGVLDGVNSPTFTLINEYRTSDGETIYHFDFYRINKLEEAFDIGFEEFVESGNLCIIEWPEKIEQILPPDTLRVKISVLDDGKRELIF